MSPHQGTAAWHWVHWLEGVTTDCLKGTLQATTLRKLPREAPKANTKAANTRSSVSGSTVMASASFFGVLDFRTPLTDQWRMKSIAKNKKAFHDYSIEERFEAGIALRGSEVKALRMSNPSLNEAFAVVRDGEVWLIGLHVTTILHASYLNHTERRERKLLLNASEIKKLDEATRQKGYTLIPLEIYFNDDNRVKVEVGLARGKAQHDKRQSAKEAEAKREMARAIRR